jgi:hypothetical protein
MILSKSMFQGVCGGNVLNDNHMDSFLSAIAQSYQHEDCFKAARQWRRLRLRFDRDIASKQRQGNVNNVSCILDIFNKGSKETTTEWIAIPMKHSTKQGALVSPDKTANSIGTSNCFSVLDNDDVPELLDRDCSIALPQ